jgi:uncharacterized 2Fe-2S/4Fe-4S cluster protein (DUF4445 family)
VVTPGATRLVNPRVQVELLPLGKVLAVPCGTPLQDVLFDQGVEFPCGGRGRCKGCRVRVLSGQVPIRAEDEKALSPGERAEGWRLACRITAETDLRIELAQWEAAILGDNTAFPFTPRPGLGIAFDLGTTTLVGQLLDLATGHVLAVRTALNAQARHGADIMSRVEFGAQGGGGPTLTRLIREQIGRLMRDLLDACAPREDELKDIVIVGNTVMHHLFCGLSVEPLAHTPFEPVNDGLQIFLAQALGWSWAGRTIVRVLPCLGGFVGSDILAGILATRLHESAALVALMDLGTNGEIVLGNRDRLLCASTAAGPAFEGARISMGMRAATGAVSEVTRCDDHLVCHVIGGGDPRGICGSGLVDAVAGALDLGWIHASGRLAQAPPLTVAPQVSLTQGDVRELQLAKGAIAAGLRILARHWGATVSDISRLYLAGAFGNYINRGSARRIGLLPMPPGKVEPAGNTALLGAKLALFRLDQHDGSHAELRGKVSHLPLSEDLEFQETFVDEMRFPNEPPVD